MNLGLQKPGDASFPHGTKPLCLNSLARSVLAFIEGRQVTTFQEVADRIMAEISHLGGEGNTEKTTRRRVYDVLNVFLASDLIVREGKSIRYQRTEEGVSAEDTSEEEDDLSAELADKERRLHEKVRMLVAYETLIRRNANRERPPSAVQLPAIIVGFNSNISGRSNTSLDGKTLEIHASENPIFYSPMDVFGNIGFTNADQSESLRQYQDLAQLESVLFPGSDAQ
jgi:hypothetical protein